VRRTLFEGGVSPRARQTLFEGGVSPRARRTLFEGGREPSSEADLLEGVPCWAALVGRAVCVLCVRLEVCLRFVFLQVLSRIPPGFLGDPQGCP
jgi:hypothetical protein